MAPKTSKREQLKQAKYEAWLEARRRERVNMEEEEFQARKDTQFQEEFGHQGVRLLQLEEFVHPENRLSVSMASHLDAEKRLKEGEAKKDRELRETGSLLNHARKANELLENELRDVRTDQRQLKDILLRKMETLQQNMLQRIDDTNRQVMTDIVEDREKAKHLCNEDMERTRQRFLILMSEIRQRSERFTDMLQESKASHSNLPTRIRQKLQGMDKEELLLIIDTLSFESEVLQYFMFKFPPAQDRPYGTISDMLT
eukprot:TRINITY_DN21647_c0_g1_i1.p1 TRINITY_DN21647_c0_g1~~TRINITY_DN21647_c0_g1_i1.p1  ORF type:complete len:280 (+),score=82.82 TRINITY_DN21647_c0_g1_i1:70-840(+)